VFDDKTSETDIKLAVLACDYYNPETGETANDMAYTETLPSIELN
jgi:hypothetical protein